MEFSMEGYKKSLKGTEKSPIRSSKNSNRQKVVNKGQKSRKEEVQNLK